MATAAKRLLNGRYRLGTLLGQGAMSTVYSAADEALDRTVAVKLLKPAYVEDTVFIERFYIEARTAAKIVDQHVISIFDILADKSAHAIVMEYADGGSVADVLQEESRIGEPRAIDLARQTAQALAAAHARGVIHRDIKPANLLLTRRGVLKVADFGLAKAVQTTDFTITQPGQMVGSVHYFSPEQAQGKALGPASDLYSLGIVVYQMIAGAVPFNGDSPVSVALAHVQERTPRLDALQKLMSAPLAGIVHRLLQKNPQQRFASASELDGALAALQPQYPDNAASLEAPTMMHGVPAVVPPSRPLLQTVAPALEQAKAVTAEGVRSFWTWARHISHSHVESKRKLLLAAAALAALLLSVVGIISSPRPVVAVPDVGHQPVSHALPAIRAIGLEPSVVNRSDERLPAGTVLAQSPRGGVALHKGDRVSLVVSSGPPLVPIPNLLGDSLSSANQVMRRLKLRVRYAAKITNAAANTVIEQHPAAGARVREYSPELVVVSAGPHPQIIYSGGDGGD